MPSQPIKGLAKAVRGATIRKHEVHFLSREAEEALFAAAHVLSEGGKRPCREAASRYYGSTMITFDLKAVAACWRGPFDSAAEQALLRAVEGSVRMRLRASRIAWAEVQRRVSERPLGTAIVETRVQLRAGTLQMDVDLEVPVGVGSGSRRAR